MNLGKYKNKNIERSIYSEAKTSKHINILMHYDDDTLIDKSGKLIKIIKLEGLDFTTKDQDTLEALKNNRNHLFKNFSSEFALYFWQIRKKMKEYPIDIINNEYANEVSAKYLQQIKKAEMCHTEHYLGIIAKQPEGVINKSFDFIKLLNYAMDKKAKQEFIKKRKSELDAMTAKILNVLSEYNPRVLSVSSKNHMKCSECYSFLSELINSEKSSIPVKIEDASTVIPKNRIFFNAKKGIFEIRSANGKSKFGAVLSIKGYSPITYPGMLDEISLLKIEYVITQSFRFYDRHVAKVKLRDQQNEMLQSAEESQRQTEQIDVAFDDTASGELGYGAHHFTLTCYADTQEELDRNIGTIIARFTDIDITCVREDIAMECGFWAQLPGNFGYILRAADISTKNLASFASLHNYPKGKLIGNHWGNALTVFETIAGSPYYFNFHYKDVGNFLVFGSMGSGKTLLVGFLILQSLKFSGKRIIFDKDRGLEILVRALGGIYEIIKPGIPTGFNPCQLDDTPLNRKFLSRLFQKMLSVKSNPLQESELALIDSAIDGMYRFDKKDRRLCHLASFFGAKNKKVLRNRFDQWHSEGPHAWLFDNEDDSLNLNPEVLGFDLGNILADENCKTPALMYLTYRIENALEGHRGILFCDEGWHLLNDDYFIDLINNWSRTPRKKDNIFGLATQVAADTLHSKINKSINESAFCKIFFPNPSADKKTYMDEFGLTATEYEIIKTLPDDKYYFLLKHGKSLNTESVILRANLIGLEDEIAIISAREKTLNLLDRIRSEVGNDPKIWLRIFNQQRKING